MDTAGEVTVYVRLVDEGVDVWRPAQAQALGEGIYRLASSTVPETETWEFPPGALVAGEMKELSEGVVLVAVGVPRTGDLPVRHVTSQRS